MPASHDGKGLAALFADNARIEDPVGGTKIVEGRAAIEAFYRRAVTMVDRLDLVAPTRTSHGASAAMAFDIHIQAEGQPILIRAIDVMTFDMLTRGRRSSILMRASDSRVQRPGNRPSCRRYTDAI